MPAPYKIKVHQSTRAPCEGSSYCSSESSKSSTAFPGRFSLSPGTYRHYEAGEHAIHVTTSSNGNKVIHHNRPRRESEHLATAMATAIKS
ncbi:hypothetical protein NOR_08571 [Metarhizium rileyi]|uniref:Uncharacterized protein n=1 Tax=Metarhizium rileyi (strain RCEF 4871) TaxID=1649241 RepID=A0A166W2Q3_METRR|nr:hypothetical protein NOR_08571 [Metarhizium rileyi RCEF 4871]TWU75506.1 hypothetical protein ED733_005584 [Metarhizium rileyi]